MSPRCYERRGQIDLEPISTDALVQAERLATSGAESSTEGTDVDEDLQLSHSGVISNTIMTTNSVAGSQTIDSLTILP
jgi:hypothetical protein